MYYYAATIATAAVCFSSKFVNLMDEKKTGAQLVGSFTVMIGDQDEARTCHSIACYCLRLRLSVSSYCFFCKFTCGSTKEATRHITNP